MNKKILFALIGFAVPIITYWLRGGDFERDVDLGTAFFLSTLLCSVGYVIGVIEDGNK